MIYDVGEPCTTDAQCECKNCTCDVEAALCIPPAGPKPTPQPKAPKAKPGPKNVFTREDYNNGAGNYTQMMWQSTHKIGCGVQYCGNMTLVDCQYKWTGNYVEGLIYEVGLPCEMDYDCMCTGCTCDREAALCVIPDHGATIQTPY
ncbi:hypothetical protein COOONC_07738 [Cooperia oncophora]